MAEKEPFPAAVLAHHYPDVPNLGDVMADDFLERAGALKPDVLVGGPPCQDFSVAGLRAGIHGARGNLTLRWVQIIHAVRPAFVVTENVPGWLSANDGHAFGAFLAGLVGHDTALIPPARCGGRWSDAGMVDGPAGRAAWRILDAQYFGLAQRRRRVFVIFCPRNGRDPAEILFERKSLRWHPPPGREVREGVAGTISARTQGGGGLGTDFELDGGLDQAAIQTFNTTGKGWWNAGDVSGSLRATTGAGDGGINSNLISNTLSARRGTACAHAADLETYVPAAFGGNNTAGPIDVATARNAHAGPHGRLDFESETFVTHALRADGFDASEDGTGRGASLVPCAYRTSANCGAWDTGDRTDALTTATDPNSHVLAFALRGRDDGAVPEINGSGTTCGANRSAGGGSSRDYVSSFGVRRLTPTECEALQGFPLNYTRIPQRHYATRRITKNRPEDRWEKDPAGGWWLMSCDGERYKALGNSMAVPCMAWIGRRILAVDAQG